MSATEADVSESSIPQVCTGVRVRNVRGTIFVGNKGQAFELSESAAFIYKAVDGERTVADIGQRLADEYGVALDEAVADVAELMAQLTEAKIVDLHR